MARRQGGEVIALDSAREPSAMMAAPTQVLPEPPSLREYIGIILKRIWVVAAFFVVVVVFSGLWVFREPSVYRSAALVELNLAAPTILGAGVQNPDETSAGGGWQMREFFETQAQIITTRTVAERVVKKLGLDHDAAFLNAAKEKDPAKRAVIIQNTDAVGLVQSRVKVEPVRDSRIARISVEDTSAERAMRIANTLAQEYADYNVERRSDATKTASDWLGDQIGQIKTKLEHSETLLYDFKHEKDILTASLEDRQSIASQRLISLNEALTKVGIRRGEVDARLRTLTDAEKKLKQGDVRALESVPMIAQNATVAGLQTQRLSLLQERVSLDEKYLPEHPKRKEVDRKLGQVDTELTQRVAALVQSARTESREVSDQDGQLRKDIEEAKNDMFQINKHQVEYTKLKREVDNYQRLYDLVNGKLKDTDLAGRLRTNNVQIIEWARTASFPVKPNRKLIMILASVLGLLGGVGLALVFEYLDNTVKTHDDVEKFLNVPFLGIVPSIRENMAGATPLEKGRNRDLYSHRRPKSSVAECVRSVRTNLLFMTPEKPLKRLLVTSSGPQEGKTTFVVNIAITMAQSGSKTLVIDTDMRRPRVHRAFGLPNDAGVSTLILQAARLDDVVKETVVPNLYVLPCGPIPPNPSELLHTARFKQILAEIDTKFDRIIFDSPPVAAVTDALVLAGDADGVVIVVKAGRTVKEVAMRTQQALDDVNARIFGVVMNDLDLEKRGYGYYYYYQRYGYYYGEKPAEG
jgi:succinoglycan biosynthesis transport protein ExoP